MNEKRMKKIEKIIAGGRAKHLLRWVIIKSLFVFSSLMIVRLLYIAGLFNGKFFDSGETIFIIIVFGLSGLFDGFNSWDRLIALHEKYSKPEITPDSSGLESKQQI